MSTILTNARLILEDEVVTGTIAFDEAGIRSVDQGRSSLPEAIDVQGDYVAPGLVETDMTQTLMATTRGITDLRTLDASAPFGFMAQPADVGAAVVYLCSEGGRYVTHQRLAVNGGGFPGDMRAGDR